MKRLFAIILLTWIVATAWGQTQEIEALRRRQQALKEDIQHTNRLFLDVKKQTTTLLERISLINKQISARKEMMALQKREIDELINEQKRLEREIKKLTDELEQKKESYAQAVRVMQSNRRGQNEMIFILSGRSLGQSLRRMQYLKEYSRWRRSQAEEIKRQNEKLQAKIGELDQAKADRLKALKAIEEEQAKLEEEEKTRQVEIRAAQGKQKQLQQQLNKQQQQARQLDQQIERLIAEEVARQEREAAARREAARKKAAEAARKAGKDVREAEAKADATHIASDEVFKLSKNFASNRGQLPMPVTGSSSIVSKFGVNKHSEWNITTNNSGIDIQAQNGADIRAVFEGEVSKVFSTGGMQNGIIIRHGDYYTFYANIVDIYVRPGDKVKTGQALGKIYTDPDNGIAKMHFQLWQKTTKLDPAPWLRR